MHSRLLEALEARQVVGRRESAELAGSIDWAVRCGELVSVLPGVYARPSDADSLLVRARAVRLADPSCIITGHSAAALHGWLDAQEWPAIEVSSRRLTARDWLRVERRVIPRRLTAVVQQVRVTSRALTAVDLIPECGSLIVDEALRRRVRLADLRDALAATPHRPGNRLRREMLNRSTSQPWSAAERQAHRALGAAGVSGWIANHPIIASPHDPPVAIADIAFVELRLDIEVDGAEHHDNSEAFARDRARDEQLARLGWQVVRFPARRVMSDPEGFAAAVAAIVQARTRVLRLKR